MYFSLERIMLDNFTARIYNYKYSVYRYFYKNLKVNLTIFSFGNCPVSVITMS